MSAGCALVMNHTILPLMLLAIVLAGAMVGPVAFAQSTTPESEPDTNAMQQETGEAMTDEEHMAEHTTEPESMEENAPTEPETATDEVAPQVQTDPTAEQTTEPESMEDDPVQMPKEQVIMADSPILITEIELNPQGEDGTSAYEWVEIHNPTNRHVYVGDWTLTSSSGIEVGAIGSNVDLYPRQFLTVSIIDERLEDSTEYVSLYNKSGALVDRTPEFSDIADDHDTWQRIVDDRDTDSEQDWVFKGATRGTTNSVSTIAERSLIVLDISLEKEIYEKGEKIDISGTITGVDLETTSFFVAPTVKMEIGGPNHQQSMTIEPDEEQMFSTSITPRNVRGSLNTFDIVVKFAGITSTESFTILDREFVALASSAEPGLVMHTDRMTYRAGDNVIILAKSDIIYEYEGLEYVINGPDGKEATNGILFPSDRSHSTALNTIDEDIAGDSQFGTTFFVNTVSTEFGTYKIVGNYGELSHTVSFEVEEDAKGEADLSVLTNKTTYELGETVTISGRVNRAWVGALDIEIVHQQNTTVIQDIEQRITTFAVKDVLRTFPDGRFVYRVDIPDDPVREGRYVVTVSESSFRESASFDVKKSLLDDDESEFSVNTDKSVYSLGEKITFTGKVNVDNRNVNDLTVLIKLVPDDEPSSTGLLVTAIPDGSGTYRHVNTIEHGVFNVGTYTVTAEYIQATEEALLADSERRGTYSVKRVFVSPLYIDTTAIEVTAPRNLGEERFTASLDSQTYEFGDTVTVSGIVSTDANITALQIGILQPNGKTINGSADVMEDGSYSFDWQTPSEQTEDNVGAYTLTVLYEQTSKVILFDIGRNLATVSQDSPIVMSQINKVYQKGEEITVSGRVFVRDSSYNSIPETIKITIASTSTPLRPVVEFNVFPDSSGAFSVSERLSGGKYQNDTYSVSAKYETSKIHSIFHIGEIPAGIRADTS